MGLDDLPYRPNVGAVLFNRAGLVFVGRRAERAGRQMTPHAWQLPQGGIDPDEAPAAAVLRELAEEVGTSRATILAEHDAWLSYDLPHALVGQSFGGRYRGQTQRWFALRYDGEDADIRLDAHDPPEFDAWCWMALGDIEALVVPFKQPIYATIAAAFAPIARRLAAAHDTGPGTIQD